MNNFEIFLCLNNQLIQTIFCYVLCNFATNITHVLGEVSTITYGSMWYTYPVKEQTFLILMLRRSQETIKFSGFGIIPATMATFLTVFLFGKCYKLREIFVYIDIFFFDSWFARHSLTIWFWGILDKLFENERYKKNLMHLHRFIQISAIDYFSHFFSWVWVWWNEWNLGLFLRFVVILSSMINCDLILIFVQNHFYFIKINLSFFQRAWTQVCLKLLRIEEN